MRVEAFETQKDVERVKRRLKRNKDKRLYPLFMIPLNTGLRSCDVVKLQYKHFDNGRIKVEEDKTGKLAEIPINKTLQDVLNEYYPNLGVDDPEEYLFKSQKGKHITSDYAYQLLKKEFKKCKFKYNTGTHSMRKTAGKRIDEKYGIRVTQKFLRHSSQIHTLEYVGIEKRHVDDAVMSLEF